MANQSESIRFTLTGTLGGNQEFRIGVTKVGVGSNPTVRLELWEGGIAKIISAENTISGSKVISLPWTATDVTTTTNPVVECLVHVTGTTDGQIEIDSAQWIANVSASTTHTISPAIASTSSVSMQNILDLKKLLVYIQSQNLIFSRQALLSKALSFANTQSYTYLKGLDKLISSSNNHSVAFQAGLIASKLLNYAQSSSVAISAQSLLSRILSFNSNHSLSYQKELAKIIGSSNSSVFTLRKGMEKLLNFINNHGIVFQRELNISKLFNYVQSSNISVTTQSLLNRILLFSSGQNITYLKGLTKLISSSNNSDFALQKGTNKFVDFISGYGITFSKGFNFSKLLDYAQSSSLTVSSQAMLNRVLSYVQSYGLSVNSQLLLNRVLNYAHSYSLVVNAHSVLNKALSYGNAQVTSLQNSVSKILKSSSGYNSTISKSFAKILDFANSYVLSMESEFGKYLTLIYNSTSTFDLRRHLSLLFKHQTPNEVSVVRSIDKLFDFVNSSVVNLTTSAQAIFSLLLDIQSSSNTAIKKGIARTLLFAGIPSLDFAKTSARNYLATITSSSNIFLEQSRVMFQTLLYSSISNVSTVFDKAMNLVFTISNSSISSLSKLISLIINYQSLQDVVYHKALSLKLNYLANFNVSVLKGNLMNMSLLYGDLSNVAVRKGIAKVFGSVASSDTGIRRSIGKIVRSSSTSSAQISRTVDRFVTLIYNNLSTTLVDPLNSLFMNLLIQSESNLSIGKILKKTLEYSSNTSIVSLAKNINKFIRYSNLSNTVADIGGSIMMTLDSFSSSSINIRKSINKILDVRNNSSFVLEMATILLNRMKKLVKSIGI